MSGIETVVGRWSFVVGCSSLAVRHWLTLNWIGLLYDNTLSLEDGNLRVGVGDQRYTSPWWTTRTTRILTVEC
jgi:hypothetical protein